MKPRVLVAIVLSGCGLLSAARAEVSFQPVALSGWPAPGFGGNATFSQFSCFSLADDRRVAFTAQAAGTGVNLTNRQGIWAGLPGSLNLIARIGTPAPGAENGVTYKFFNGINLCNYHYLAFIADLQGPGIDANSPGSLWVAAAEPAPVLEPPHLVVPDANHIPGVRIVAKSYSSGCNGEALIHGRNTLACGVDLYGDAVGFTNNEAILAGSYTNWVLAARSGSPAPGTSGNFSSLVTETKSLTPAGEVAFKSNEGLWFGAPGAIQAVALTGGAAPASLFGPGCAYAFLSDLVEVNASGEVAFTAYLSGPGLVNSNSQFVVAGPRGGLRTVAQSGQPAPGISGAVFRGFTDSMEVFSDALIGTDGGVAFVAAFSTNGYDYGLWLAPRAGSTRLIARSGGQAPGTPAGVVFMPTFQFLSPFSEIYMNGRNQIAFHANLSGPGVGSTNNTGIWLAEPDGTVSLVVRSGDTIDAGGVQRQLGNVTFGSVGVPTVGGPEDGRAVPLNDRGELLFWATYPSGQGLFLARTGIILNAQLAGSDLRLTFPTLAGKHYRVDHATNFLAPISWSVLEAAVVGTSANVTVTNSNAGLQGAGFYRVVRTD